MFNMGFQVGQPKTLQKLALLILTGSVTTPAYEIIKLNASDTDKLLSRHIENTRYYLTCKMPKMFHDSFAEEVKRVLTNLLMEPISKNSNSAKRIGRIIEIILTDKLTSLSLGNVIEQFQTSLTSNSHMITGLVDLRLIYIDTARNNASSINERVIIQLLKESHNLKYLTLNGHSDFHDLNNILKCIVENCKLMEELELFMDTLSVSKPVDILLLTGLSHLKSINLTGTEASDIEIATVLVSCVELEHISGFRIEEALEFIAASENISNKQFKLLSYESTYETTFEKLQLVIKMCPLIQNISLEKGTAENCLRALDDAQYLREIELNHYNYKTEEMKHFLQIKGRSLKVLNLQDVKKIDLNALLTIGQVCPNLENLIMRDCSFEAPSLEEDSLLCKLIDSKSPLFREVKSLDIHGSYWTPNLTSGNLLFLLTNCLNVEMVTINDPFALTDEIMSRALDRNPLIYLRKLNIHKPLSTSVIDRIIQNCITPPEVYVYDAKHVLKFNLQNI